MERKALTVLFFTLVLDMIGIGMVIPIIPILFTDPSSPSFLLQGIPSTYWYFLAGLTTAIFGIVQFFASPLLGELSDVYGRKKLLFLGVSVLAISQCIFGLGIITKSLTLILVSRFVGGFAAANFSIAQATIADISSPSNRAKNFGLIGAAFGIGFVLGPALSGYLAHSFSSAAAPFWVAGLLGVGNMLVVYFFLPETNKGNKTMARRLTLWRAIHNITSAFTDKDISHIYKANFFYYTGFTFFTSFSGLYLVQKYNLHEAGLGTYFAIIGVCIIITQTIILRIVSNRKTPLQILQRSMIAVGIASALTPFMPSLLFQYLLIPFIAIPQGLSMANLGALLSSSVAKEKQGLALGINGSLSAFSQGLVPLIGGILGGLLGVRFPFIIGGLCTVYAWHIVIKNNKEKSRISFD
jgi:DHA1 family tetracycline resistance protein-like MFS transporter